MGLKLEQVPRYGELTWFLWKYGGSDLFDGDDLRVGDVDVSPEGRGPKDFARDLEALGPTYIKLGQLLSTRADLLPQAYVEELARLQDDVAPVPFGEIREVVEEELGVDISKAFSRFDERPIASASLAQVHRAALRDGREVAVKVQRPDLRETIVRDMRMLSDVAELLDGRWDSIDLPALVADLRRTMLRELDYRQEVDHLTRLHRQLADYAALRVPQAVEDLCSSKVLTMEYISGHKITDLHPVALIDVDGSRLADELFRAYLDSILCEGFFHADPHPGNILLTDDHRLAFVDLGMVAELGAVFREQLLQLLVAVAEGHGAEAARTARAIGTPTDAFDEAEFQRRTEELVQRVASQTVEQTQVGTLVLELERSARQTGFRLPREFTLLAKTLLNLDQIALRLEPDFDPAAALRRHAARIAERQVRESWSVGTWLSRAMELKRFVDELPRKLNRLLDTATTGGFHLQVDALDEDLLVRGFQKVANRITAGLVIAAMIVGAALIMNIPTSLELLGYPLLGIALFLGAMFSGAVLLWNIVRHDR